MSRFRSTLALAAALIIGSSAGAVPGDYGESIQPLLADHCYACHGPDEKARKAGLRFDQRDSALAELKSGARAIVPGEIATSEVIRRIFSDDPDEVMPPPKFKKRPSEEAKIALKKWIADGAVYEQHWAFEPVRKPAFPAVKTAGWPRNAIDHFILARLEEQGMRPSEQAAPETLLRRISLDLRGLPPSPTELADGIGDYEGAINVMLESPHYGERMAQDWLDLARYGDTNGYHNDSDRSMWPYRDYVINAFNKNKPYDQFIVENMAGDLLPDATEETRIASGFHRCVTFNEEGGADPDEFYVTYAVDRANTTGQVFLGLTVGCAQCHDHKYDPISQKEYYQLYAFFNSVEGEIGAGGQSGYHNKPLPPLLKVVTPQNKARLAELEELTADARKKLDSARVRPEFTNPDGAQGEAFRDWLALLEKESSSLGELPVKSGLQLHLDAEYVETESNVNTVLSWKDRSGKNRHAEASGAPRRIPAPLNGRSLIRLDGENDFLRTQSGGEVLGGDFTIATVLRFHNMKAQQMALMWGEEANGKRRALWKTDKNKLSFNGYNADVIGTGSFNLNETVIALVTKSGNHEVEFALNGNSGGGGKTTLGGYKSKAVTIGANNADLEKTAADYAEILVFDRALAADEQQQLGKWLARKHGIESSYHGVPAELSEMVNKPEEQRSEEEQGKLFNYFIAEVNLPAKQLFASLESEGRELQQQLKDARKNQPTTMVMVEMEPRKPAHVLMRGDFQQPGELVQPDVPSVLGPFPQGQPRNRLGLARWLVDPNHPLVARVTVNRMWKQFFGTGLVKTLGDLGTQGERPSHPLLLDWLAADFIEYGWDVKHLQRQILQSATYQQSSAMGGRVDENDPHNRLLSRAPRFRLSAEEVRDSALAISGLLNRKRGGPSVMPVQPAGYLSSIGKNWNDASGADRYRRGIYTFWRRTMLYPTFQIFDAPSREFCAVNRARTNTPLQALVTLNDPAFVEAARAFAKRVLGGADQHDSTRLRFAFQLATSRIPNRQEVDLLTAVLEEQRQEFSGDPDASKKLVAEKWEGPGVSERAAWISVANIILNLDETITRE
jgi:hypothetical protein